MPTNVNKRIMLMLTSYMDESGHAEDVACNYVGIAGLVAPYAEWELFDQHWQDTLNKAGLSEPFHMKDFAHSEGQFKNWKGKEEKRKRLIGRLVEIIRATRATPIGAVVSIDDFSSLTPSQQSSFLDPYYVAFQTCARGAAIEAVFEDPAQKVAMVFSFNSEFGGRAEKLWDAIKEHYEHGNRMRSYASATPSEFTQLQAADLFAYELVHEFENRKKRPDDAMRWPLRQILGMYKIPVPQIMLFDRKELLRRIKESHCPDQTAVEEIDNWQMLSAQESMMRWLIERGEFTPLD